MIFRKQQAETAPEPAQAAPEAAPAQSAVSGPIPEEQAKQIALQHAGLMESQVVFARTELDFEHGKHLYEIEFYSGQTEYDYDIDAETGDILSFDQDAEFIVPAAPAAAHDVRHRDDGRGRFLFRHRCVSSFQPLLDRQVRPFYLPQFFDVDFSGTVRARQTGFHPDKVVYSLKIQFRRVFDSYDSFIFWNE